ncbi:MAG: four helix bundle suffix domain-containing protein [Muribaculaceae bacterium]|nr:four helix bundle suffix domain-containing protein [Muribaculaceae bacterium]MDE6754983.1 four helix bundle suffix domain-containing protein [Muribaculaceae bacterium]
MGEVSFIPQQGFYRNLRAYQLAEIIYDITFYFTGRFFRSGDRTVDQMVQAARSGKQNIAEGSSAGSTSKETEIKLTNVAKASLQELLIDYEDYLRVRGLEKWDRESKKVLQTRNYCKTQKDSSEIIKKLPERSDETIANIAITLIHQADKLLYGFIEKQKRDFLRNGGIREQMSRARREFRGK